MSPAPETSVRQSLTLPGEVIIQAADNPDLWIVGNVFTRTYLGLTHDGLLLLRQLAGQPDASRSDRPLPVWDITKFGNAEGLLADPTGYIRATADWPEPIQVTPDEFLRRCLAAWLLVDDMTAYRVRFAAKESLLDRKHFGNFHQRLGQELLLKRREEPNKWWLNQKFTPDHKAIRPGPYRAVQEAYLDQYFPKRFSGAELVVDVGCGSGYFARKIAAAARQVIGVDPNRDFIELARRAAPANARFEVSAIGDAHLDLPDASADFVFMSDALLFYFVAPATGPAPRSDILLSDIRRILKPGGRFISVEPSYLFWLQPWFGSVERPFTILTEYFARTYGATPAISRFVQKMADEGFAVSWMDDMQPAAELAEVDPRAYAFAREFPLWQLFEFALI